MVAGDDLPVDEPHHHVGEHHQGEQRRPPSPGDSPCASTRNGIPHSSRNTIAGNWVVKCTHIPSRVPGSRQDGGDLLAYVRAARVLGGRRLVALGVVLQEQQQQDEHDDPRQRAAAKVVGPAEAVQRPGDDEGGDQVARHPEQRGDLRRSAARAGPGTSGCRAAAR